MRSRTLFFATLLTLTISLWAQRGPMTGGIMSPPANMRPPGLEFVGIEQHLNAEVPGDLEFRDELGNTVRLGDYFAKDRPVILDLGYYQCPMLCGEVLQGLSGSLRVLKFEMDKDYEVVTVSFDPRETTEMAAEKKREMVKRYGRPGAEKGWHFLTGSAESINALTKAIGYQYQWDEKTQQYAHATAIVVLTPDRHIAEYLYGVEFSPRDLRLGLVQASQGKVGNIGDQVLLYCYHYDPRIGKYGAVISNILRLSALATMLILGTLVFIMFRADGRAALKELRRTT